jgi:hypothetical protein
VKTSCFLISSHVDLIRTDTSHSGLYPHCHELSLRTRQTYGIRERGQSAQSKILRIPRSAGLRVVSLLSQSLYCLDCSQDKTGPRVAMGVLLDYFRASCLYYRDERHTSGAMSAYICVVERQCDCAMLAS